MASQSHALEATAPVSSSYAGILSDEALGFVSALAQEFSARVRELLEGSEAKVGDSDLIREVSIFAERCDINEEITRMRSHLAQFDEFLNEAVSMGRKLEFLTQEMFREVNTIGSKANDVTIAHSVVEMKAAIEKMREILQNVE